ncbi:MAG: hypothetical protein IKN42_01875 [Elusimicrobia bacterium]|nr:hypothetical protein [Elusimicrobiota bacterium]
MIKKKLQFIFLYCLISAFVFISILYFGYYMYYEGYTASEIDTCDTVKSAVEQVLLSKNTQEKKKELIKEICKYPYAEITVESISDDTMFYKKESWIKNKKLFKEISFSEYIVKTDNGTYSIKYTNFIPKFYTAIRYCIFLGKHMTSV